VETGRPCTRAVYTGVTVYGAQWEWGFTCVLIERQLRIKSQTQQFHRCLQHWTLTGLLELDNLLLLRLFCPRIP